VIWVLVGKCLFIQIVICKCFDEFYTEQTLRVVTDLLCGAPEPFRQFTFRTAEEFAVILLLDPKAECLNRISEQFSDTWECHLERVSDHQQIVRAGGRRLQIASLSDGRLELGIVGVSQTIRV
jgi:hypothetical protein